MNKIAIISPSYFPNIWNGQGRSTFSAAYILAKLGNAVTVYTYTPDRSSYKQQDGQVTIQYIGGIASSKSFATTLPFESMSEWNNQVYAELKKQTYTHIILINSPGWEAANAYRAKNTTCKIIGFVPFLYTFVGWLQPLTFSLESEMRNRESEFILNSDILVAHTYKFGKKLATYADRELLIVPNCHLDLSASSENSKSPVVKGQICFVGKANREKSLERVIRILAKVENASLVISSPKNPSDYLASLYALAKKLDVEHRLSFIGWKPTKEIRALYKSSELAVVPSVFEPFGYAALDPMALGVPVIVSEWSCLAEYIENQNNVFSSLDSFADKVRAILEMPSGEKQAAVDIHKERIRTIYSVETFGSLLSTLL